MAVPGNSWRMTSAGTADLRVCSVECANPPTNPGTLRHVVLGVSRFLQVGHRRPATYGWVSQAAVAALGRGWFADRERHADARASLRAQTDSDANHRAQHAPVSVPRLAETARPQPRPMPNSLLSHNCSGLGLPGKVSSPAATMRTARNTLDDAPPRGVGRSCLHEAVKACVSCVCCVPGSAGGQARWREIEVPARASWTARAAISPGGYADQQSAAR